jgi:hypothetical protein
VVGDCGRYEVAGAGGGVMNLGSKLLTCSVVLFITAGGVRAEKNEMPFSGNWQIDLRTQAERANKVECGIATFELHQSGKKISGSHTFATPSCGRINDGGDGTVKGYVVGQTAFLVVTSGRNGAIVMGRADRVANSLRWLVLDEIKGGEPEGDSDLILSRGTLHRSSTKQ